jgi:hypothetical protein
VIGFRPDDMMCAQGFALLTDAQRPPTWQNPELEDYQLRRPLTESELLRPF